MNIVLLVIDSLRARALGRSWGPLPNTPFLHRLCKETVYFSRAYATECWTLPTHASMFTGMLPSEHGAHFRTMAYTHSAPTIAEVAAGLGYDTEVVTRNSVFDGTLPGITRGFQRNTRLLSEASALDPFALLMPLAKRRLRRQIEHTGFFHPLQRQDPGFPATFARALIPADRLSLDYVLERMEQHRRNGTKHFIFCNLYDVHAPYPPSPKSILRPLWSLDGLTESLMLSRILSGLGQHTYLRAGFHLSQREQSRLLRRYHRAIELMDAKLQDFYLAARGNGLLDDTLLIITSDHGEAFGEHGLYLHDASVYDMHLHVPLWIHHPERAPLEIEDVVSTRDLFGLMRSVATEGILLNTILDRRYRAANPIALAEHFHYPGANGVMPEFKQDLAAVIAGTKKVIVRKEFTLHYNLAGDWGENLPIPAPLRDIENHCRELGASESAVAAAMSHLAKPRNTGV